MSGKLWLWISVLTLTIVYLGLGVWGFYIEPSSLTTHRVTLKIPHWPKELQGLKIAVLADLHVGSPYIGIAKVKLVVARTNRERPDLVLILGDYLTHGTLGAKFVEPEPIAAALKKLRAPLGVVSVLGNHDWWFDGARVTKDLRGAGIVVLENQACQIEFNGKPFWIAGIADLMTRKPDVAGTLRQVENDDPIILITHNPDIFPQVPSRVSLTLAGHTHGGQVNLPWLGRLIVPSYYGKRYAAGLVVENGRHFFVSTGIGTSILPVRFRVPPEIDILTLQPE
ncbi:MAG TPA: metallophosphoesterase [Terriglobia bacterium]|nr:metallophosphoesterase [Terriglobia bacterium]